MVNKKFEKYYWLIGVISITLISLFIVVYFCIVPLLKSVDKSGKELKANKQDLSVLKDKLDKLKVLKDKEDELKKQEATVNGAIPTKKEVGDLFVQIDGMLNASQGTTSGIKEAAAAVATQQQGSNSTQPLISADSSTNSGINLGSADYGYDVVFPSYANFKEFLKISENAHRFIYLNSFSVDSSKSEATFNVSLNYKAYYRQQAQKGGAAK